jgi:large subunit ribosomal protein L5
MAEKDKEEKKKPKSPEAAAKAAAAKARKAAKQAAPEEVETDDSPKQPAPPARLYERYRTELVPALQKSLGLDNVHAVPRLEKIVISMGLGRFAVEGGEGKAKFQQAEKELQTIAGQKPVRCKAKKSVANFKVREGMDTGVKVTLRGTRMYEFLDRMITLAFPRVKDFRGIDPSGFDKSGNYNFGFTEQTVFPEVDGAAVTFQQGMNITMVTKSVKPEHGRELLKQFGMPFREPGKQNQ